MERAWLRFAAGLMAALFVVGSSAGALAQAITAGERVAIGSTGDTGTVLQIGQATPEGGVMVKVLLDKPAGPALADREVWYNSRSARVTALPRTAAPATPSPAPAAPALANAAKGELKAGDRVRIGSLGVNGTVVQIGGTLGNGAVMLLVTIDQNSPKFPGTSKWYDTKSSEIVPLP